jgi:hypothetical protein
LGIYPTFGNDFLFKLATCGSILHLVCIIVCELKHLVKGGLCPKLQYYGTCKFSLTNSKASASNPSGHIKDHIV